MFILGKTYEEGGKMVCHVTSWKIKSPGNYWYFKQKMLKKKYPIYYKGEIVAETISCRQINSTATLRVVCEPYSILENKWIGLKMDLKSVMCMHCLTKAESIDELCDCLKMGSAFKSTECSISGFVLYDADTDIDYYQFLAKSPIDFIILN